MSIDRRLFALYALVLLLLAPPLTADDASSGGEWPGFRGPVLQGRADVAPTLPAVERPELAVVWKHELGSGYSGVSVAEGLAVTFYSDGEHDAVVAFDATSGEKRWTRPVASTYRGHDGSHDGPISTPLIAGGKVFALAPRGELVALEAASGEVLWKLDVAETLGGEKPYYGFSASPLVAGGSLIVAAGNAQGAMVVALDPASGEQRWSAGGDGVAYQSPFLWSVGGEEMLLAVGNKTLVALDPASGEELWTHDFFVDESAMGNYSLHPVPVGSDRLFLNHGSEESQMVRVARDGDGWKVEELWKGPAMARTYSVPVVHDDTLYGYTSRFLNAVDAASGEILWRSRPPGDGFVTLAGDRLVIVTKQGSLHLAEASREGYEELAAIDLFERAAWTPPSLAHGRIYARSTSQIAALEVRPAARTAAMASESAEGLPPAGSALERELELIAAADDKRAAVERFLAARDGFPWVEAPDLVHFLYRGEVEDISLAGDLVGSRVEKQMHRLPGTDLYHWSARLEPDARVAYYFVENFEERIPDPRNPRRTPGPGFEQSWVSMPGWSEPAHLAARPESERGTLETVEVPSEIFDAPRTVGVWLPPGYAEGSERYSLAIVHDGGRVLERSVMADALAAIAGEKAAPFVAAFVHQPEGSQGEELRDPDLERYLDMLEKEVVPFLESRYRLISSPEARAHVGMGFTGPASLLALFRRPELARAAGVQSTFMLDPGAADELIAAAPDPGEQPLTLYLDWGRYDLRSPNESWDLRQNNRYLAAGLERKGLELDGGEANDGWAWGSWQNRWDRLFAALFPPPESD